MKWVGYQLRWLADPSPQKVVVKSRRIGFSEIVAFEAACRAVGIDIITGTAHKPVPQNFVSSGYDQAKTLLARALLHVEAFELVTGRSIIESQSLSEATLSDGTKLRAFSTNPRTMRSFEGDLILDEFGGMPRVDEVWAAAAPLAKPTLGNREGYKIRVVGTPLGDDNRFYKMVKGDLSKAFSVHSVDCYAAKRDGFPIDIEALREEMGDPDSFAQEYECSFLSASARYISAELWDRCIYYPEDFPDGPATWYGGMDVARHRDASAIVRLQRKLVQGDSPEDTEHKSATLWHIDTEAERGMRWADQRAWVDKQIEPCAKFGIDESGLGSQFAEELEDSYPGVVERVTFSNQSKEDLATGLRLGLERRRLRPRADDTDLRRDVMTLRRQVTPKNNVVFDAPRTKTGHADRAWALALAVQAAGGLARGTGNLKGHVPTSDSYAPRRGDWGRPKRGGLWGGR